MIVSKALLESRCKRFHQLIGASKRLFISKFRSTIRQERCSSGASREGFGSFHSQDIEVLIRQADDSYSHPEVYSDVISKLTDENDAIVERFDFGFPAKKCLFELGTGFLICLLKTVSAVLRKWHHFTQPSHHSR